MNWNQIIAITVLGIAALMLGCKPNATGIGEVAGDPIIEPKPNPVKELTLREKVIGTYEWKSRAITYIHVYLENGIREYYTNGKKGSTKQKWSLVQNEIHVKIPNNNELEEEEGIIDENSIITIKNIYKNNMHDAFRLINNGIDVRDGQTKLGYNGEPLCFETTNKDKDEINKLLEKNKLIVLSELYLDLLDKIFSTLNGTHAILVILVSILFLFLDKFKASSSEPGITKLILNFLHILII